MDNNEKEFELDDILKEFGGGTTEESDELISQETLEEVFAAEPAKETASNTEIPSDTIRLERIADARSKAPETEPAEEEQAETAAETEPEVEDDETKAIPVAEVQEEVAEPAPVEEKPLQEVKPPIVYDPRARIRELKRKLVAGPEKL